MNTLDKFINVPIKRKEKKNKFVEEILWENNLDCKEKIS